MNLFSKLCGIFFPVNTSLHNLELCSYLAVTERTGGPYPKKYGRKQIENAQFLNIFIANFFKILVLQMIGLYSVNPMMGHTFLWPK